ncbi:MAG: helix-turn-helix domain-containing protein [Candidatus Dadabacteria bacterium]|nr:helix-turn-helix domain-containing protein [Candidatus Dadabacteria bacterium]
MNAITVNHVWKYRNKKRIGQKRLAHLLGHGSHALVSRWENGQAIPNVKNLLKLSYILQVSIEALYPNLYKQYAEEVEERQEPFLKEESKVEENKMVV